MSRHYVLATRLTQGSVDTALRVITALHSGSRLASGRPVGASGSKGIEIVRPSLLKFGHSRNLRLRALLELSCARRFC